MPYATTRAAGNQLHFKKIFESHTERELKMNSNLFNVPRRRKIDGPEVEISVGGN